MARFRSVVMLLLVVTVAAGLAGAFAHQQEIGWRETVARFASERGAVRCVGLLKNYGDPAAVDRSRTA